MEVGYHHKFRKALRKLPPKIQDKFFERLEVFLIDPYHPQLNNHPVGSAYPYWRSINITGDYRALYEITGSETVMFMKIGTHSQLYR